MRLTELEVGKIVRVKNNHKSKPLRRLMGPITDFYKNPSGWTAVKVELPAPCGTRTFQPTQLEAVT